jgi:hypothetical protein
MFLEFLDSSEAWKEVSGIAMILFASAERQESGSVRAAPGRARWVPEWLPVANPKRPELIPEDI